MGGRIASVILAASLAFGAVRLADAQPRISPPNTQPQPQPQQQPQQQQGQLLTHLNPDDTAKILQEAGYKDAEVYESSSGRRHVRAKLGQLQVFALHANCEAAGCRSIILAVFFGKQPSIDWNYINAWYNAWRFTRLYRNDEGDLVFDMDLHLYTGATPDYVKQASTLFAQLLNKLLEFRPAQK